MIISAIDLDSPEDYEEEEEDSLLRAVIAQINKDKRKVRHRTKRYLEDFKLCSETESRRAAEKIIARQFNLLKGIVRSNWEILAQLDFEVIIEELYRNFTERVEDQIEALNPKTLPECVSVLFMRLLITTMTQSRRPVRALEE